MSSDDELDELLRLTEKPLPLRGDREGELLDELLGDLAKGEIGPSSAPTILGETTTNETADRPATVAIQLEPTEESTGLRRLSAAALALAVAVVLVVGLVLATRTDTQPTDTTESPDPDSTIVTTTTELPPLLTVEEACMAFAVVAPDRIPLRERVTNRTADPTELDPVIEGLDVVIAELERRGDIDDGDLTELRLARGGFVQAQSNLAAGTDGGQPFGAAEDRLRLLQMDDPRFQACWRF